MNFATPLIVLNPRSPEQKISLIRGKFPGCVQTVKKFMYLEIIFFNVHCQIFAGYTLILFKTFYNWGMLKSILFCCFSLFCLGSYEVKTVEIFIYLNKWARYDLLKMKNTSKIIKKMHCLLFFQHSSNPWFLVYSPKTWDLAASKKSKLNFLFVFHTFQVQYVFLKE